MLMEQLPGEWQERMHDDGPRPFSQWVERREGTSLCWHLNLLNDALAVPAPQGDFILDGAKRESVSTQAYICQCAEYLLTMENDLKSGAFDNFMRKLTPLLTNRFELYLAKLGKNVRQNGVDSGGRWQQKNTPADWQRIPD